MKWLDKYEIAQAGMTKTLTAWEEVAEEDNEFNRKYFENAPPKQPLIELKDTRKIRSTTGKPMREKSDFLTDTYDINNMNDVMQYARKHKLNKDDMWNLISMEMAETGWGNRAPGQKTGHVLGDFKGKDADENFVLAYKAKMKEADRLGMTTPHKRLQVYNGTGPVFPSTEADYRGSNMDKIYGVPIPKEGLKMNEHWLYGKNVIDIRENVLKKNKDIVKYIDSTTTSKKPVYGYEELPKSKWGKHLEDEFNARWLKDRSEILEPEKSPTNQNGGWLDAHQNGGCSECDKVKDDNGYWDPKNHGKVVEINSNNITMKGVNQPLLGVSDTGDIQLMQPGQDYKFKGKKVTEYPIAQNGANDAVPKLSVEEYRNKIREGNYNMPTPYMENTGLSKETVYGNNCIHGVCTAINTVLGDESPLDKKYVGNMSFEDNTKKLGFNTIGRRDVKEIFAGDVLQYQALKSSNPELFPNVSEDSIETFPFHSSMVARRFEKDGVPMVTLANNGGYEEMKEYDYPLSEILARIKGTDMYPEGVTVQRYDPEAAAAVTQRNLKQEAEIAGENEFASLYDTSKPTADVGDTSTDFSWTEVASAIVNPIDKLVDLYEQTQAPKKLAEAYTKNYKRLGKTSNVPPKVLDKMFTIQVGLANQETKFGTSAKKTIKDVIPEAWYPNLRDLKDSLNFSAGKIPGWVDEYYKDNVNGVRTEYSSVRDFAKHIKDKYGDKLTARNRNNSKKSKGMFQQKELSPRGRHLKADFKSTEGQFLASMGLMLDNYHSAKEQYNVDEETLLDITTLMHNAPELAGIPEYVNYFIAKKDSDYVNKVRGNRKNSNTENKEESGGWLDKH